MSGKVGALATFLLMMSLGQPSVAEVSNSNRQAWASSFMVRAAAKHCAPYGIRLNKSEYQRFLRFWELRARDFDPRGRHGREVQREARAAERGFDQDVHAMCDGLWNDYGTDGRVFARLLARW